VPGLHDYMVFLLHTVKPVPLRDRAHLGAIVCRNGATGRALHITAPRAGPRG